MNKIKEIRKDKGFTLKEVAERANTTMQQVQRLERGDRRLTTEWIERLALALNCTPAEIVPSLSSGDTDEWIQGQIRLLEKLDQKERELLLDWQKLTFRDKVEGEE